jgi:sulfur carrier protein
VTAHEAGALSQPNVGGAVSHGPMSDLQVKINGRVTAVAVGTTIGSYVDGLGRGRKGIAVAVGDTIVRRALWDTTALADGDQVEILTAAQGG